MLSLLFFLASSVACVITFSLIKSDPEKIVDIVHHHIPRLNAPYLSDVLVLAQTVSTAGAVDLKTLSEVLLIMGAVQFLRALCSLSTALPPLKNYHDKYRMGGINGTGTEYIFSGHASYSALSSIYLYRSGMVTFFPLMVYNLIAQFLIIVTHNHYTVDIVLAWIIVPLLYGNVVLCRQIESCNAVLEPWL